MTHSFNSCAKIAFQIAFNFITSCLACACPNTGGRVLMLVMTACGNFAFTWIFWSIFTKYSTKIIVQIWTTKCDLKKE